MCVIIVKPQGVKMPNIYTLYKANARNPHGIGFCTPDRTFKTQNFCKFLDEIKKVGDEPCIIHFRYATHGSVGVKNCHPFEKDGLKFAHNGVLPIKAENDMTDSETAFQNIIYPAFKEYGYDTEEFNEAAESALMGTSSKFAFMYGDHIKLFGDYIKHEGCYFSNLYFM